MDDATSNAQTATRQLYDRSGVPNLKEIIIAVVTDVDRKAPIYTNELAFMLAGAGAKPSAVKNLRAFLYKENADLQDAELSPALDDAMRYVTRFYIPPRRTEGQAYQVH